MKYLIPYRKEDQWGFCNADMQIIIECVYDDIVSPFSADNFDLAMVSIKGKTCWINQDGIQISPLAESTERFTPSGISIILMDSRGAAEEIEARPNCLFIDAEGNEVFRLDVCKANPFYDKKSIVYSWDKKFGVIDESGNYIRPCIYDDYILLWQELGSPYFPDVNTIEEKQEAPIRFSTGDYGYYGFKDRSGNTVISPIYAHANEFSDGASTVAQHDKEFHHIDKNGTRLYPKNYYYALDFHNGIAKVVANTIDADPDMFSRWGVDYYVPPSAKGGYIDKSGNEYWEDNEPIIN